MDLSALIFVALAVAWAVYLVPKALRQHEEDAVSRSVDGFSDRLRVLARREPVSATEATLIRVGERRAAEEYDDPQGSVDPADPADSTDSAPATPTPASRAAESTVPEATDAEPVAPAGPADVVEPPVATVVVRELSPDQRRARRAAARRAAQRRRRVLGALLLANLVLVALATPGIIHAAWIAVTATLLVAWLVACRLMVKRERGTSVTVRRRRRTSTDAAVAHAAAADAPLAEPSDEVLGDEVLGAEVLADDETGEIPAVADEPVAEQGADLGADPNAWTPVAVPLPTYVDKAPAGRTVRTIDLDSTGVWSSGRNEADSQLAREADAQRAQAEAAQAAEDERRRATGS